MNNLSNYVKEELCDIRNSINEDVKYYTLNQSIKLLKNNLSKISNEDDKAVAVYNALGDGKVNGCELFYAYGPNIKGVSKIIVKDIIHTNKNGTDNKYQAIETKYKKAYDAIMQDSEIANYYERGKEIIKQKIRDEKQRAEEAKKLRRSYAYKEFCNTYKGAHILYKSYTLYNAWQNHHLWTKLKAGSTYNIIENGVNSCKSIKASEAEPGKYYVIVDHSGPNLLSQKDERPGGRYNIINEGTVVKCVGVGKWNVILYSNYSGYKEPNMNAATVEHYFDTNPNVAEFDEFFEKVEDKLNAIVDVYIREIKDDIGYNEREIKAGRRVLYPYSEDIINLIEKDTI